MTTPKGPLSVLHPKEHPITVGVVNGDLSCADGAYVQTAVQLDDAISSASASRI